MAWIPLTSFFVPGEPRPGGSKRAMPIVDRRTGHVRKTATGRFMVNVIDDAGAKGKDWRSAVKLFAREAYRGEPTRSAARVSVTFYRARPKGHYGSGRNADQVKASAPVHVLTKPDATKLWRSTEDALTGILWVDDSQVVVQEQRKEWGSPGADIKVWVWQGTEADDAGLHVGGAAC